MAEEVTFYSKKEIICPVCNTPFKREDLLSGRGRLNAGDLTNELRRMYIPTQKFGEINPLVYPMSVCPNCLYSADKDDFENLPKKTEEQMLALRGVRAKYMIKIFGAVPDFNEKRDLVTGTASYVLAISSYSVFPLKKYSPTIKKGLSALRAAWLFTDLFKKSNESSFSELSELFYRKANEFYQAAMDNQTRGKEPLDFCSWLGPDTDVNYGYDGFLYVYGVLKYKNSIYIEDPYEKIKLFEEVKRILSKVFGMGRKAKDKPQVLLNLARDVYDRLGEEIDELQANLGDAEPPAEEST